MRACVDIVKKNILHSPQNITSRFERAARPTEISFKGKLSSNGATQSLAVTRYPTVIIHAM
jgi:hypothetical protein